MSIHYKIVCVFLMATISSCGIFKLKEASIEQSGPSRNAYRHGMVVTAHPIASEVGLKILKRGGNAIDAAIAVHFSLAVVYPSAGNLGGGGFMVYRSFTGSNYSLDFRETAPADASRDMYLDMYGNPIADLSLRGHLASGIPGSVAGMSEAHERFGRLPWNDLLQPAIELAANGFPITAKQAAELNAVVGEIDVLNPEGTAFVNKIWNRGELLIQKELAHTLRLIRDNGRSGFYEGEIARRIVDEMKSENGIISLTDLKNYEARWREPLEGSYRGYDIISMPPPSSGGIALIQLLKSVETFPLSQWGVDSDSTIQVMIEAARRVYADRSVYLGDPDFSSIPREELLNPKYNAIRMSDLNFSEATPSATIKAGNLAIHESDQTTHFSIVDNEGSAVALTTTLNGSFGSRIVVKGAGFLMNNEMDDFSVKPGYPNMYGLIGGAANGIEPSKRMLSSMTPTIVCKDGKLYMVLGTPGGSTIITSVFQTILNVIDWDMDITQAVSSPRFHHQWMPDVVKAERSRFSEGLQRTLQSKGYRIENVESIGRVDAILVSPNGVLSGGADPRGDDTALGY